MAVTSSENGAVIKAGAQADLIPGRYFKAIFWVLDTATLNTDLLELTETDGSGHVIYADVASKTHGVIAIPCPHFPVEGIYVNDLDNGYILAYPAEGR